MTGLRVEVRSRVTGAGGEGVPDVLLDLASERTTVRELIRRAVEEQVRLLRVDAARCRRALDRQYLSMDEIRAQAATGVVRLPSPAPGGPGHADRRRAADLDVATEVAQAHRAFDGNVFVVFVGGRQVERLDEEIVLVLGQPVAFLRLVPLVGG